MEELSSKKIFNLAVKKENENNTEDAIKYYREALIKDPNMIKAWLNLGALQIRMGNEGEAILSLKNALRLDKRLLQAHLLLAQVYKELGKDKQTEVYLTNAYKLDVKNKYVLGALAIFYFDTGRFKESLEMVDSYLQSYPDEKNLRILKSEIFAKLGNYKDSLSELNDLVHKDPGFETFLASVKQNKITSDPEIKKLLDNLAIKTNSKIHEFKAKLELSKENPEDFSPPDPQDAMDLSLMYLFQGDSERAMKYLVYAKKVNEEMKNL